MKNLVFSVNVVAPLFTLISMGFLCKKINFIRDEFLNELNRFIFRFCLPIMLFQDIRHTYQDNFSNMRLLSVILISMGGIVLFSFLCVPLFTKKKGQKGCIIQGLYRSNVLIFGFPIIRQIYGQSAIGDISMFMCIVIPIFNVLSIVILGIYSKNKQNKLTIKKIFHDIFTNPLIIGSMTGFGGGFCHLKLYQALEVPLDQFAKLAAPLALFAMGGDFKFQNFRKNFVTVTIVTIIKLIVIPIAVLSSGIYLNMSGLDLVILLSFFATPTAIASFFMAKNMNNDFDLAGQIVVFTTFGSCFTIFLFIYFLRTFGYL